MNEVICPNCNKAFKIDEAGFADILKQVRNHEFSKELQERLEAAEKDKENAIQLAEEKTKNRLQAEITKKESELIELKSQNETLLTKTISEKDAEIIKLQTKIQSSETEKKLALNEAVSKLEKERDELASELKLKDSESKLVESSLKEKYETQIKDRDDSIERLRDMKAKLNIKLLGENLEQHCQNEFNNVRSAMFPYAYFEKDNEAVEGTKGDYIYRDFESKDGVEVISIMFEMKDEQDTSENKRTVESHLKKLDSDRTKKIANMQFLLHYLKLIMSYTIVGSLTFHINTKKCM